MKTKSISNQANILMLLSNPAAYDPRPLKEAISLIKNGYNVIFLAWDREGNYSKFERSKNLTIKRFKFRARYGHSPKTILGFLFYYFWCIINSFTLDFNFIHCHDADTLFCGYFIKILKRRRVKLIYDMHDHPIIFFEKFPMRHFWIKITLTLAKRYADHIIVVNDGFVNYLLKFGFNKERITVIMNVPRKSPGWVHKGFKNKNKFTIFYYGNIELDRGVLNLIKAVKDLKNVELLLAGRGKLVPLVKNIQRNYPNIKYLGWVSTSEIERIIKQADLVPSLYPPDNINNILASPNKLFTCMSEGIPVLVPKGSYQAVIVKRYNCGLAVDMNNIPEIKNAILELFSSPEKYLALGSNGIKAINSALNWQLMEKYLLDLYKKLGD